MPSKRGTNPGPLRPADSGAREAGDISPAPSALTAAHRLLIIDDDTDFGKGAVTALTEAGLVARFHRGARGSLQVIRETGCDVVLVDVNMPLIDGQRLVRMIRETFTTERIRILLCSGMNESFLRRLAITLKADGVIAKPGNPRALVESVVAALTTVKSSPPPGANSPSDRVLPPRASLRPPSGDGDGAPSPSGHVLVEPEQDDLLVARVNGPLSHGQAVKALAFAEEWCHGRPYFLLLCELSGLRELDASARDALGGFARRVPPHAVAMLGAPFTIRVTVEMIHRAVSTLTRKELHREFLDDEGAARSWLAMMQHSFRERSG